ncbi:MAG TPA: hypothetical protein VKY90_11745 [Candidatus Dormibacteraeota bacterium]|nr:hypothetical protein [Candidatus Dormibacteraeota bacterium]
MSVQMELLCPPEDRRAALPCFSAADADHLLRSLSAFGSTTVRARTHVVTTRLNDHGRLSRSVGMPLMRWE